MQDTSTKSQNNKNDVVNTFYKNCKNERYKTKSNFVFQTTLLVVWSLVVFLFLGVLFSARPVDNDKVSAARGPACFLDILFDLGYDESKLTGLDTFLSLDSSKLSVKGTYHSGQMGITVTLEEDSFKNGATLSKFTGALGYGHGTYSGDYTFPNATLVIDEQLWGYDGGNSGIKPNIVLTSLDLTPLSNYLSSLEMEKAFIGFEIVFPTDGNVTISKNIVTSGGNYLTGVIFTGGYNSGDIGYGCILKAVWGEKVTTSTTTIMSSVSGVESGAIFLYVMSSDGTTSQLVLTGNMSAPLTLTQNIGDSITILVSKPYMWTMTVSGDCTLDTANKNKITYTVTKDNKNITFTFSGGASSSMICI